MKQSLPPSSTFPESDSEIVESIRRINTIGGSGNFLRPKSNRSANVRLQILRASIFTLLGSVCINCGFPDRRALQIDHKYGGGTAMRKRLGAGIRYHQDILRDIAAEKDLYQILCANCNWIKRYEKKEVR